MSLKRKAHTALDEKSATGAFVRVESGFRNVIEKGGKYEPASGRYHLYVSYACPWAHRTLIVRALKGLEDVVSVSVTHPTWGRTRPDDADDTHTGWIFRAPGDTPVTASSGLGSFLCDDGCVPDPLHSFACVRDVYDKSNDTSGKYSVPVLWDKQTSTIVNNESSEIIRMFGGDAFAEFATKNQTLDLYPSELAGVIDAANAWIYPDINNGVYKCGFAKAQAPYDEAVDQLFKSLDRLEELLGKQRYVAGDNLTEADVRAVVTLWRFDEVYVVYFKTNKKFIHQYPNILNFCRELYQLPGVAATLNMDHIKTHYFTSHVTLNAYSVIPAGYGAVEDFGRPHNREKLFPTSK